MKTILTIALILNFFGAINYVLIGLIELDILGWILGTERTIGTYFLLIITGISAIIVLIWGLKQLFSSNSTLNT